MLHFASAGARVDIIEYLLSDQVSVNLSINEATSTGWTPLISALAPIAPDWPVKMLPEAIRAARLLLAHGADPAVTTAHDWTPLHCLAIHQQSNEASYVEAAQCVGDLVSRGALVNARAEFAFEDPDPSHIRRRPGVGILWGCHGAHYARDAALWGMIIRSDITPLHLAVLHGAIGVAKALLKHGADPTAENLAGNLPARIAGDCNLSGYYPVS